MSWVLYGAAVVLDMNKKFQWWNSLSSSCLADKAEWREGL